MLEQARGADLIILRRRHYGRFLHGNRYPRGSGKRADEQMVARGSVAKLDAVITGSVIVQAADGSHRNRLLWARPDGEVWHYDKRRS